MASRTALAFLFCLGSWSLNAQDTTVPVHPKMIFAADTQAPMWVETVVLKADHNREATKMLFHDIGTQNPEHVFLLGDVVNLGSSSHQWKPMDKYLQSLRDKNIKVDAVLGNHEVMGECKKGEKKFEKRFADHRRTGYVEVSDSVAVVLLNSNFTKLTREENEQQVKWYKKTLQELDADPSIVYIITGCHHSPFTDSKIVSPSKGVQENFVPFFMNSTKSRLFLSGHCHGFEHYQVKGKDFLVIGGGGGIHQPLNKTNSENPDLASDYKPMFHYITVQRAGDHLEVTSRALQSDFTAFNNGMTIEIGKPAVVPTGLASSHAVPAKDGQQ